MKPPTPKGGDRPNPTDEQQTLLQWSAEPAPEVLQTGIQANSGGPRIDVGPIPLTRVADYELLKEVGRGGMGVVFKARHVRLNRIVALKMIRGGLANSDELQRFEKEASAAARLQHPNIVALFEVSNYNQQPFLSMEFIGGTSLAERVSLGPLSCRRAAGYLEATARAVHYAHSKGIIHRDLKPANVLLDDNDQPKVTDFGLAKQMETGSDQTRTGAVLGTPSYMSPEQAAGRKDIGPTSDIYSLGAILYELMTGKPPFCGETPLATLSLVADQDPLPPRTLNPTVDRDLETICLKCLEKSPARRYESAESLANDLRRYLDGEPIEARRVGVLGRSVKWFRRNPAWAILSTLFVVVTLGSIAFTSYIAFDEKDLREQAEDAKQKAEKANNLAALRLETMRHLLYLSEMRQAQQTLRRADLEGTLRILNGPPWQPKVGQSDLRDWEWYFLKDQCLSRLAFGAHHGQAYAVAYRPDGKQLASAGGELNRSGQIKVWDAQTGKLICTLHGHDDSITALAYHPDKNWLASASYDQTVKVWNLDTQRELVTLSGHTRTVSHVAFSPGGDLLASASQDHTVRLWKHEQYRQDPASSVRVLDEHKSDATSVAFHPSGTHLASGSRDRTVKLWNVSTGKAEKTLREHEGDIEAVAFNGSGSLLISAGGRGYQHGEVCFWETEPGNLRDKRFGLSDRIVTLSTSRDGKIAAGGRDGMLRIWNRKVSSEPLTFRGDPQRVNSVALAPDGHSLISAGKSGRISLWNSSGGLETRTLQADGPMETVAFHPGDRYLAAAGSGHGEVRVWDLETFAEPIIRKEHKAGVFCLAFSPDGRFLASGSEDHTVHIVDFRDLDKTSLVVEGHKGRIHALAYRPDGLVIATASEDETIRLIDSSTGNLRSVLSGHTLGVLSLAFSPDGQMLASAGDDKTIRLWDLKTGTCSAVLTGHTNSINAIAFSPDGLTLASASNDRTIRLWDVPQRKLLVTLEHSPGKIQSLAFHPHGRRLVSVGEDRMIRLWDIVTRQEILEFEENIGPIRRVVFSADGRHLAGAGNGVVRVWQAAIDMPASRPAAAQR